MLGTRFQAFRMTGERLSVAETEEERTKRVGVGVRKRGRCCAGMPGDPKWPSSTAGCIQSGFKGDWFTRQIRSPDENLDLKGFKFIDRNYAVLGTLRFAHLLPNSFLSLVPLDDDLETVREFRDHVEVSLRAQEMFEELSAEREVLAKAVSSLNMVRRKGKPTVSLLNVEEEDEDDV
ncbi:hypothetical protein B0H11DRAFT_2197865 [Mycena galericulata]|nr:hypothetical protein B0H11DRAFT_2197865 [Mycena galericulata]